MMLSKIIDGLRTCMLPVYSEEEKHMVDVATYTDIRANLSAYMNKVCKDRIPLIITRQKERPVVMISLEDYNRIEDALHLMRNPKGAKKLIKSVKKAKRK